MPPCWRRGEPLNPCALALFRRDAEQRIDLGGPWHGWRIAGHKLIGPGGVVWTPDTLRHARVWQKSGFAGGRVAMLPAREPVAALSAAHAPGPKSKAHP